MRSRTLDKAIVAAALLIVAAGAWALMGRQEDVGKQHAAAGRADHSRSINSRQVTEPIREPIVLQDQGTKQSRPAAAIPQDLHPASVTITRIGKLQDVKVKPPQEYRVTDKPLAARLYQSLLSLEFVPDPDHFFCPMDMGISYALQFAEDGEQALHVKAAAGGCRFVYADDGSAYRENDEFRQVLMEAMDMNEEQLSGMPGSF